MKKGIIVGLAIIMISIFSIKLSENFNIHESSIDFDILPVQEVLLKNRAILLDATITKDNEKLKDANRVYFEIREAGSENYRKANSTNLNNGTYRVQTTFPRSGEYYIRATVENNELIKTSADFKVYVDKA
ncbi:FixH family protein [Alkalihalobacillus trypoxylicola]|uniref:YtkA-like domain-containing protein n=1 Tax=Alkalihalobacillus trypoxylicola TaxID=519424 RepID=A0A162D198_9BACI|nr:FixH family protein [Alkalihalobacillus trypoxylicola]KYG27686.1 hypothetical protein AZF04_10875 [Alkalihalobacillus trypoxylicola]